MEIESKREGEWESVLAERLLAGFIHIFFEAHLLWSSSAHLKQNTYIKDMHCEHKTILKFRL